MQRVDYKDGKRLISSFSLCQRVKNRGQDTLGGKKNTIPCGNFGIIQQPATTEPTYGAKLLSLFRKSFEMKQL